MSTVAHIVGWGKYVPSRVLTNDEISQTVDTSDEWIRSRTGIAERRIAGRDETTATMATQAARQALSVAGVRPSQVDLVILATITPDYVFPATACLVQDALGAASAAAFDLVAGCSGFVYGLSVGASMIASDTCRNVLVIGAETLSRVIDWTDRDTCVLFGDGAGAVLLQANGTDGGILSTVLGADGSGGNLLWQPAGGSKQPASHYTLAEKLHTVKMKGREVFRFAVRVMPAATRQVLEQAGLTLADVDLVIPHQANQRIIDSSMRALGLSSEVMFTNLAYYGNTSAASIPIALCEAAEQGRLHRDDLLVCVGFGAGLTWAAAAIRWSVPLPTVPLSRWDSARYKVRYSSARVRSLLRRFSRWLSSRGIRE